MVQAYSIAPISPLEARVAALQRHLAASPYWAIRKLICEIECDRAILRGVVPSFYQKQVALALALRIVGGDCVHCEITVSAE